MRWNTNGTHVSWHYADGIRMVSLLPTTSRRHQPAARRANFLTAALLSVIIVSWVCVALYLVSNPFIIWENQITANEEDQPL